MSSIRKYMATRRELEPEPVPDSEPAAQASSDVQLQPIAGLPGSVSTMIPLGDDSVPLEAANRFDADAHDADEEPVSGSLFARIERSHVVPLARLAELRILRPDEPKSQIAEEYRSIKRPLLSRMETYPDIDGAPSNAIMVTSCVSGEGKTFSAVNLALSLAMEKFRSVILIDTDAEKSSASRLLGFDENATGLLDLLREPSRPSTDCMVQTNIPGLALMPVGANDAHSTELLGSPTMKSLVQELASEPDTIIVFDSAPLLVTNEANVMASLAGQIVFVVAAEQTSHSMVGNALAQLNGHAGVSLLLNKAREKFGGRYGYGYGYGYGYRYGHGAEGRS